MKKQDLLFLIVLFGFISGCNDRDKPFQETLDLLQGTYVISEARFLDSQYSDSVVYEIGVISFDPCLYDFSDQNCSGYIQAYPLEGSEKNYFLFNLALDDWNKLIIIPRKTVSKIVRINNTKIINISFDENNSNIIILDFFNKGKNEFLAGIPPNPYRIYLEKIK